VVAADSDLAAELAAGTPAEAEFNAYLDKVKASSEMDRLESGREKTGVFLERYAINPVNGEKIPVYAADYVLADYGTGAIMAVPAHDQRDLDFARTFKLPVTVVVDSDEDPRETGIATTDNGVLINSGPLDGLTKVEAIPRMIEVLEERGTGSAATNYRLRDWLISRQRYWGTPIPIIHCEKCGEVAVPEDQLPVELPSTEGLDLSPKGVSPLATAHDWVNVPCPNCGGPALRDTDTMDTFVDSSWYFLRYADSQNSEAAFDPKKVAEWLPVDQYVGGVTHAILHLLYARFWVKVAHDMGLVDFVEPFTRLLNQGMVLKDGSAMSKSRGNLVRLTEELEINGVDAIRLSMVFAGPPEDDIDWAEVSPSGSRKFLARAWRLAGDVTSEVGADPTKGDSQLRKATHKAIRDGELNVESLRFNVLVARVMELVNATRKAIDTGCGPADPAVREAVETVAIMLSVVCPYTAEEMWMLLGHEPTVARAAWPTVDPTLLVEDSVTCVVQIGGKIRDKLQVSPDISQAELEALAMASTEIIDALKGQEIRMVVVRAPKLVNIVLK
jgi:leucyl-tRNA synthetase